MSRRSISIASSVSTGPPQHQTQKYFTFNLRAWTLQLTQGNKLSPDLRVLVHQDRRRVPLRISLDTHVRADLTELDVPELGSQLPPQLGQDLRLDVPALRGEVHQHKGLVRGVGHLPRVVDFLERIHLVEAAGLLEG